MPEANNSSLPKPYSFDGPVPEGVIQRPVLISHHPLIQHKIGLLRRKETSTKDFWELASEVAMLLLYEATTDLKLEPAQIETPICETTVMTLAGKSPVLVPILRAGLGMYEGIRKLIPQSDIGLIGLYRNEETREAVRYYSKLPTDSAERPIFLLDPMLATGNSACDAMKILCELGCEPRNVTFICLLAAQPGLEQMQREYPEVQIVAGAYDEKLNEQCYIVPGLGDAGDRIFGTK